MTIEKECKAPNCTNEASKLRCPDCAKYQINSLFCSQDCFKKCWKQHKNLHKIFNNCQRMLQAMTQEERDNLENDFKGGNIFAGIYYTGSRNAEGQKHGHGTFYWLNGSVYEGEFSYDKQNGRGKHFGFNGDVFEGEYKNDQMHGYGEYRWADGGVYKGTWERDKMHGHGFRTWPNGAHHEGEYRDGLRNGEGKMVHSNGEVFNGIFVNDEKKEGQYTFITGDVFIGPFRNDRPEGNGKLIKSNGEAILGHFRNGVFTRGEKKKASSDELCISDLEVGRTHNGQVLSGIIISKPMKMSALHFTLQDSEKAEMTVSVYNYPGYQDTRGMIVNKSSLLNFDTCGLEKGKKIRIRNPYCKVAMDGQILIRVDDFSNIEFMN